MQHAEMMALMQHATMMVQMQMVLPKWPLT